MRERALPPLARRMLTTQMQVTSLAGITLLAAVLLIAPQLFADHLAATGETDPLVQEHAEEAFRKAGAIALGLALAVSLILATILFKMIGRRISNPVEELTQCAEDLGHGNFDMKIPSKPFSDEVARLGISLEQMGERLREIEITRSRLLSDLAHEMRTPLATLELYSESLQVDLVPREVAFQTIDSQIRRLHRLAQDLREVSLAEEHALVMEFIDVDLNEIIKSSCAAFAPRFEAANVELSHEYSNGPIVIRADAIRLQQVFGNLLDNALRHSASGGKVSLTIERAGADVVVRVSDEGTGIPHQDLERVFTRFYRVDQSRVSSDGTGSGLGLTIARAIVESHGGSLVALSPGIGKGATLLMTIPTSSAPHGSETSLTDQEA